MYMSQCVFYLCGATVVAPIHTCPLWRGFTILCMYIVHVHVHSTGYNGYAQCTACNVLCVVVHTCVYSYIYTCTCRFLPCLIVHVHVNVHVHDEKAQEYFREL